MPEKVIILTGLTMRQQTLIGAAFASLRDNLDIRNASITAVRPEHEPITKEEVDTLVRLLAEA